MVLNNIEVEDVLYVSPAGPILARDVLWGFAKEIERSGHDWFAHKTGFSERGLVDAVLAGGFPNVYVAPPAANFEIRVLAFKREPTPEQRNLLNLKTARKAGTGSSQAQRPIPQLDQMLQEGARFHSSGDLDRAERIYRNALQRNPRYVPVLLNLGALLRARGRNVDAIGIYRHGLVYDPKNASLLSNMGHALEQIGMVNEAIQSFKRAIAVAPGFDTAYDNLGHTFSQLNRYDEARRLLEKAVELNPRNGNAWNNLAGVNLAQCRMTDAIACYRKALELKPTFAMAHSNVLFGMNFVPDYSAEEIAEEHRKWNEQQARPLEAERMTHGLRDISKKRLRVGFVSPDFKGHPVGRFLAPLFRGRNPGEWEAVCYSDVRAPDMFTDWFRRRTDLWRDSAGLTDAELAKLIREDKIDILIDLAGHTGHNRLLVLARKPSPVQASWIGYFNTTGMDAVDYLIADSTCVPPEHEHLYTEKIIRMPDDFLCYDPPEIGLPVTAPPALEKGYVTFCSFNQLSKASDAAIAAWVRLLEMIPDARLVLRGKALNDKSVRDRFAARFADAGVAAGRVDLLRKVAFREYFATYNRVDISLDTFPFVGGTTTCDSLWMGTPVVTFTGDRFCHRHSASHLITAGLAETVAPDLDGYIRIASELAADVPRLADIKATLREQMVKSPLCDAARFARSFEHILRLMWRGEIPE
jgi:predicted O-linked N-acetylglucosamine transferase (SPINDLY family)